MKHAYSGNQKKVPSAAIVPMHQRNNVIENKGGELDAIVMSMTFFQTSFSFRLSFVHFFLLITST